MNCTPGKNTRGCKNTNYLILSTGFAQEQTSGPTGPSFSPFPAASIRVPYGNALALQRQPVSGPC